jgi:hypothetical protein
MSRWPNRSLNGRAGVSLTEEGRALCDGFLPMVVELDRQSLNAFIWWLARQMAPVDNAARNWW